MATNEMDPFEEHDGEAGDEGVDSVGETPSIRSIRGDHPNDIQDRRVERV